MRKTISILFPYITLIVIFALCNYLETTGQSTQSPSVAILITHAGDTNSVANLYVKYTGALDDGKFPLRYETTMRKSFHIEINGTQGGAKWTNSIEIPFENIRRITFAPTLGRMLVLDDLKSRGPEFLVEKRDGSFISIKRLNVDIKESYIYEETDPSGKMIKSFPFDGLSYSYKKAKLIGYNGNITTPFGEKGGFDISKEKVQSIEFK
jgi:hypothetical protein